MASIVRLSIVNSSATVTFPPAHYGAVGLAKAITALSWPSMKSGPAGWFPRQGRPPRPSAGGPAATEEGYYGRQDGANGNSRGNLSDPFCVSYALISELPPRPAKAGLFLCPESVPPAFCRRCSAHTRRSPQRRPSAASEPRCASNPERGEFKPRPSLIDCCRRSPP